MKLAKVGALSVVGVLFMAAMLAQRDRAATGGTARPIGAPDFTVTSAADAGPGTLRDAILAADRLSTRAHILITAKRVSIDSALPALVNPHGVIIEAATDAGVIDAAHQQKGAALQISSPGSVLRGLHVMNAHDMGVVVGAPGVEFDGVSINESKVGIVLGVTAKDCSIRTSVFEHDGTAISADPSVVNITVVSSIFRNNVRAGVWSVGSGADSNPDPVSIRIIDSVFDRNASGVVFSNRSIVVQKSRFLGSLESAVMILGGGAQIEDNEIRGSIGSAISVASGSRIDLARNTLIDNKLTAIMARNTQVTIENNKLQGNGFGIVSITDKAGGPVTIRDNVVAKCSGDAITVIGGSPRLQRNQLTGNTGAGLRIMDLSLAGSNLKATPQLDGNVLKGNGIDAPPPGVYRVAGTLGR